MAQRSITDLQSSLASCILELMRLERTIRPSLIYSYSSYQYDEGVSVILVVLGVIPLSQLVVRMSNHMQDGIECLYVTSHEEKKFQERNIEYDLYQGFITMMISLVVFIPLVDQHSIVVGSRKSTPRTRRLYQGMTTQVLISLPLFAFTCNSIYQSRASVLHVKLYQLYFPMASAKYGTSIEG